MSDYKSMGNAKAIKEFFGSRTIDETGTPVSNPSRDFMQEFKALSPEEKQWFGDACREELQAATK